MFREHRATAFRLVNELEGLIHGITADHVIVPREVDRIRRWLVDVDAYRNVEPFAGLARHLEAALSDGVLSMDECQDLLFVAGNLSAHNPYFDQLRAGLQQLMGVFAGVSADGLVSHEEATRLVDWSDSWAHLKGLWPFDECEALVYGVLKDRAWSAGLDHLRDIGTQFPIAGHVDLHTGELPPVLITGICAIDPAIEFEGRRFAFTGISQRCERREMERAVENRRGEHSKGISKKTHYLVVCDEGSPYWAFACYGRKVEQAYTLRRAGHPLVIAREADFWDALQ